MSERAAKGDPATSKAKAAQRVPVEDYQVAVDTAQIRSVRLIKSVFDIQPEGFSPKREAWRQSYNCQVTRTYFDLSRKLLTGLVSAEAWCKVSRKKIISLKCDYLVAFDVGGNPTEEAAELFVKRLGAFSAFPYFRAHFAEVTSQAGIALPPLPIMRDLRRTIQPAT